MFDMVNRLLWCIPISNSAEKTISIGNVLSQFTYNRLSPTRKIFIITKEQIHIQIRNAKLQEKLDSRPKSHGFEPHRRHCVVSLSKNINPSLVLVQPRKTRPFITERLLIGRKESNQTKSTKLTYSASGRVID